MELTDHQKWCKICQVSRQEHPLTLGVRETANPTSGGEALRGKAPKPRSVHDSNTLVFYLSFQKLLSFGFGFISAFRYPEVSRTSFQKRSGGEKKKKNEVRRTSPPRERWLRAHRSRAGEQVSDYKYLTLLTGPSGRFMRNKPS